MENFLPGLILGGLLMWTVFATYLKTRTTCKAARNRVRRITRTRIGLVTVGSAHRRKGARR